MFYQVSSLLKRAKLILSQFQKVVTSSTELTDTYPLNVPANKYYRGILMSSYLRYSVPYVGEIAFYGTSVKKYVNGYYNLGTDCLYTYYQIVDVTDGQNSVI